MRHAYLIIAHSNFGVLTTLLKLLDDDRNDIYLHLDKKVFVSSKMKQQLMSMVNNSSMYILDERINVHWGHISQVKVELLLFKEAFCRGLYAYFHLLSGVDLPIKSQDYIHSFFQRNEGKEFIGFSVDNNRYRKRVDLVHLFPSDFRSKNVLKILMRVAFAKLQQLFHYSFLKGRFGEVKKGTNWVSVTANLVAFILEKEDFILESLKYSYCSDEIFIQTLVYNSTFKEHCYSLYSEFDGCMRLIDWDRGLPYVWKFDDLEAIKQSDKLFARKFSDKDADLMESIYKL